LVQIPLFLVVAQDHPLARRKKVTAEDVMRFQFITGLSSSRYMEMVCSALAEAGIGRLNVAMQLQDSVSIMKMVRIRGDYGMRR